MKNKLVAGLLLLIVTVSIGFIPSGKRDYSESQQDRAEYLGVFSKLYGYIRYFHPSDEASAINWDRFLCYGIEQVSKCRTPVALLETLDSLFLPIAPSMDIYFAGNTPEVYDQPEYNDDPVLVSWQHIGVKADPNPVYKSIRLGRIDWAFNARFGIFQQFVNAFDCGNKKFRLSAIVKTSGNGKGQIELVGYAPASGRFYYRVATFEKEESESFLLEDQFGEGISILVLTIRLTEKGMMLIDDLEFQLEKEEGILEPFSISNNQFLSDSQDVSEDEWNSNGLGYKYSITESAGKTSVVLQSTDEYEYNSLFTEHCSSNESITRDLGMGLKCRFPLALHLSPEPPEDFSGPFLNLKNKLDQVQLERNSANLEATRIGSVMTIWNMMQHFYPYFDVTHADWDSILIPTLSEAIENQDMDDFLTSLRKMTAALEDGHVRITHPTEGNLKPLPLIFDYVEERIVVVASGNELLQKGDIVLELDGKPAKQLLFNYEKTVSGSPQWKRFKALRDFTRDDSTNISDVKIRRDNQVFEIAIDRRAPIPQYERPGNFTRIRNSIYYIDLCSATLQEIEDRIQEISKAEGVVFDLRGYPNSNHGVISYLTDQPVHSALWNKPEIIYPDHENIVGYDTSGQWTIEPKQPRIQGKVVFLTNGSAISYAESFMGIIEYYQLADIVGSRTAGANGNVNTVTTLGGFKFQWTGMKVLKQDGSQHHLVGIEPTIPMKPTIRGIQEGRDELIDKAIEIISHQI